MNKKFTCPSCGFNTKINSSRADHALLRRAYAQCKNPSCGASWRLTTEISAAASPSGELFAERSARLRVPSADSASRSDQIYDLALHFIRAGNPRWSRDEALEQCASYLLSYIESISRATAEITAARAVAEVESGAVSQYAIDCDRATSTSIIINRNPSADEMRAGRGREEYVVSLREIVDLIEQRIAAAQDGRLL